MLLLSVRQNESVIHLHISALGFLFEVTSHIGQYSVLSWVPYAIGQVLIIYFIYNSVYVLIPISQFIPPLPYPLAFFFSIYPINLFFTFVTLLLFVYVYLHLFFWFHIKVISYDITFCVWCTSLIMAISRSIHVATNRSIFCNFYDWVIFHFFICTTSSLSISL